jgi:hypothetical protein
MITNSLAAGHVMGSWTNGISQIGPCSDRFSPGQRYLGQNRLLPRVSKFLISSFMISLDNTCTSSYYFISWVCNRHTSFDSFSVLLLVYLLRGRSV